MAWLRIFFLHGYARSCNLSCLDPFISYLLCPRRKTIGLELELNPGPLASQATALTTRPLLLGRQSSRCTVAQLLSCTTCLMIIAYSTNQRNLHLMRFLKFSFQFSIGYWSLDAFVLKCTWRRGYSGYTGIASMGSNIATTWRQSTRLHDNVVIVSNRRRMLSNNSPF